MPESLGAESSNVVACPKCGSTEWQAVEQISSLTPCVLVAASGDIEVVFDARAELSREAATSVITNYLCANEECAMVLYPAGLKGLLERWAAR